MPGRQQIPSFQIASGTTNERDNSYNISTGSIFYNTDTSNVEIRHEDPNNSVDWRDFVVNNKEQIDISGKLVAKNDVSFNAHVSVLDASFQNNVTFNTNRPTSSLSYPSSPAGDNDFITRKDYNDDLRDGTIVQVKQTYFSSHTQVNVTGDEYHPIPGLDVSFVRKSENSHCRVSFLIHYGSNNFSNHWVFNSVRLIDFSGNQVAGSTNTGRDDNQAGMSCANTFTNGVLQCLPISGCFIDDNPTSDTDGTVQYSLTIKPDAAGNGDEERANPYTINSIEQNTQLERPRYCSYIMLEEIYQKS